MDQFSRALSAAAVAAMIASGAMAQDAPPPAPEVARPDIRIEAPRTRVEVDSTTGRTLIQAPRTFVAVDPQAGTVRVRAPWLNLDVRW